MLVVETLVFVVLVCESRRSSVGEQVVHFDSQYEGLLLTNEAGVEPAVAIADNLETAMSKDFASVSEVRHVLTERADGNLLVWIAVDDPRPEVRKRIYQKELSLIEGFPEVDFDFNLIPAMGRAADDLATGARVVFSRTE